MTDRSVIWITLESIRYDHTSFSDHERDTTPHLVDLATTGYTSDHCFSHDIWTRSSTTSILTGYAPSAHQTWSNDARLPSVVSTIPAAFQKAGYRTVCISESGQISSGTGLDRGFDHFKYINKYTMLDEADLVSLAKWAANIRRHSAGFTLDGRQHCLDYLMTEIAKGHIDTATDSDEPLFLYLHLGNTHHPYFPPSAWRDKFIDDLPMSIDRAIELAGEMNRRLHECIAQDDPFTEDEWQTLQVLYDTCISYNDSLTGLLAEHALKELEDPIVVVTADHGELFDERGILAHMLCVNDAVTNVPVVIKGLEEMPDNGMIQHADIMKMLCTDLGIDHPVPIGQDIRKSDREVAVTQRSGERARTKLRKISEYNSDFPTEEFSSDDVTALRSMDWRYVKSGSEAQLFELPDETVDVSEDYPAVATRFDERCEAWLEEFGQPVGEAGDVQFDEQTEAQLRNLGYRR